jgi:hypothetical protein
LCAAEEEFIVRRKDLLYAIDVKSPCGQDWGSMHGNDEIRFCDHCVKDVHNLSAMRHKDVRKLIARSDGGICVRYIRRPDGRVETLKRRLHQITRRSGVAAGVISASLSVSTLSYSQTPANPGGPNEAAIVSELTIKENISPGGVISGVVTDQNGAVINFALITACTTDGAICQSAPTNAEGFYEIRGIPEGKYKLKIDASGFDSMESGEFNFSDQTSSKQDFQLEVSKIQTVVQVGSEGDIRFQTQGGSITVTTTYISNNKLISAVQIEDVDEVKRLIGIGKKVNVKNLNYDGNFPLHYAVEHGNLEIVDLLLNAGARISVKNYEKRTPLMMIDEDATVELVNRLLGFGSAVNAVDKDKNTVLIIVAGDVSEEVVRALILNGANINAQNKKGRTALMQAVEEGNLENVQALLEAGADINLKDKSGETAWNKTSTEDIKHILVTYGAIAEGL